MCTDGSCKTVQCKAEVGSAAEVEVAKSRLRFELKVQAQSLNGTLNESSVSFSVRLK
jgi:hypothetical protein